MQSESDSIYPRLGNTNWKSDIKPDRQDQILLEQDILTVKVMGWMELIQLSGVDSLEREFMFWCMISSKVKI